MKRAAVITMGVCLDGEKGYSRFRSISEAFVRDGYDTTLMTTTFQHWEKKERDLSQIDASAYPYHLRFFYEPGYKRNIDLRRIKSHAEAAENLKKLLEEEGPFDVLYSEIPPNDMARTVAEYASAHQIPYIVDVNDLWPEAMKMVIDIPGINRLLYGKFEQDAERVYSLCSGVIGTSDEYRDRPFKAGERDIPRETVYVGNDLAEFDAGVAKYAPKIKKKDGEFWVTYAGTIGKSYDIKTMVLAGEILKERGRDDIGILILGDGPDREKLEALAKKKHLGRVKFLGYQPYPKMAAVLNRSDVTVNSFVRKAPQNVVTKIGDYLASGHPMINTSMSAEFRGMVERFGFGVNIEPEDAKVLADAIVSLADDPKRAAEMGRRARETAEKEFDRKNSYGKITEMADHLSETIHK